MAGTTALEKSRGPPADRLYNFTDYNTLGRLPCWLSVKNPPANTEMATHSSILAWRIPWTEEAGRLWSMGPQRVRHD